MRLRAVENENDRWSVQIEIDPDMHGLSAGTWMSNMPTACGLTINAPDADQLREIAALLRDAADQVDEIENPPTPAEMDRENFERTLP